MILYRVRFSNYEPPEVDSIHAHKRAAEARLEELRPGSDMWEIDEIGVAHSFFDDLISDHAKMLALLQELEFCDAGNIGGVMACPKCGANAGTPHRASCRLAALLKRLGG